MPARLRGTWQYRHPLFKYLIVVYPHRRKSTIVSLEELTSKRDDDCSRQHTIRSTNTNVHALPLPCPCLTSWEFRHFVDCGTFNTLIINKGGGRASGRWTTMSAPLSPPSCSRRCALLSPPHAAQWRGSRQRPSGCPRTISRSLQQGRLRFLPTLLHSFSSIVFAPPPTPPHPLCP